MSQSPSSSRSSPNFTNFLNHYNRQFSQIKKQQEDARASAFYDQEQKTIEEKKKLHDDPASLWGGDVGLALARLVNYAQESQNTKLQDLIMSLEYEMHSQMIAVQEGIDELKQRLVANEKEIQEERNLIASQLSIVKKNNKNNNNNRGATTSSPSPTSTFHNHEDVTNRDKRSTSVLSKDSTNTDAIFTGHVPPSAHNNHHGATGSISRPTTANDDLHEDDDDDAGDINDDGLLKVLKSSHNVQLAKIPPTIKSLDKVSHTLHTFPMLIAEALWRELKCESVNIYIKGKDNASNILYSVPHRAHDVHTFKRLHRSVETAVFQHQVAVCAWDAASKQQQQLTNYNASLSVSGGLLSGSAGNASINSQHQHQSHPQSYVVWPIVLVDDDSLSRNQENNNDEKNNNNNKFGPAAKQMMMSKSTMGRNGPSLAGNQQQHHQHQQTQPRQQGARYKTVACIECVNKKISTYSMLAASINQSNLQHQQMNNNNNNNPNNNPLMNSFIAGTDMSMVTLNNTNNTAAASPSNANATINPSSSLLVNQMKMQFSKSDEAIIASSAKLLASCFEAFPSSAAPTDTHNSHKIVAQFSKIISCNIQPLPHETPSVITPSAVNAVESAVMSAPPTKLFRGPSAGVFKPMIGHQQSDKVPSSPAALASTKEAKTLTIDSFTHDGNLRSLEASISYLDSMWKAAFSDNVGMHEECRKMSTKIRDLSFICSQVEECFAAARKMNSIDDIRSFLRTAELSLKSGSRALLGTAMKISLESQINSEDMAPADRRKAASAAAGGGGKPHPPQTAPTQQQQRNLPGSKFLSNDKIAISEIHIDGPEGLRHYTVDPSSKKAQMEAIEKTMEEAMKESEQYHRSSPVNKSTRGTTTTSSARNNNNKMMNLTFGGRSNSSTTTARTMMPPSSSSGVSSSSSPRNPQNQNQQQGTFWLRHHHNNNNTTAATTTMKRDIATPKSLQSALPKIPPLPSR